MIINQQQQQQVHPSHLKINLAAHPSQYKPFVTILTDARKLSWKSLKLFESCQIIPPLTVPLLAHIVELRPAEQYYPCLEYFCISFPITKPLHLQHNTKCAVADVLKNSSR